MASKLFVRKSKHLLARIATKTAPCAFCKRDVDDEIMYGKLYAIGNIHCHYYCVLLSCCLIQKGKDEEGLFGFLYSDILTEIERSKKHRCSYCNQEGATLGCSVTQCRKQFHLPCGRERNAVSMFHGNYKTYCQQHAPKQKIPYNIMENIKDRKHRARKIKTEAISETLEDSQEMVCVICYERVDPYPTLQTFWPPCCARDAWFHRSCLQRMALSAGIHYLKCPLCNDKKHFHDAVLSQGYYIPDRDAAWELEQNAFAEIYDRTVMCNVQECKCPNGRDYDLDSGPWDIKLCLLCGSVGAHTHCAETDKHIYVCPVCKPAAPDDPKYLEAISEMTLPDANENAARSRHGPIMPSRMSLRRTKPRINGCNSPSSSNTLHSARVGVSETGISQNTLRSRQELNLKTPKRKILESNVKDIEYQLLSPIKLLEQRLYEKLEELKMLDTFILDSSQVIDVLREKLKKPQPLAVRKRIVNKIIDNFLNQVLNENTRVEEPIREWNSPKKCCGKFDEIEKNITEGNLFNQELKEELENSKSNTFNVAALMSTDTSNILTEEFLDSNLPIMSPKSKTVVINNDSAMEISEKYKKIDIKLLNISPEEENTKVALKFSPSKEVLGKNIDIDLESFKNHYLSEVDRDSKKNPIDFDPESIFDERLNFDITKQKADFTSSKINKNKVKRKRDKKIKKSTGRTQYEHTARDTKYLSYNTDNNCSATDLVLKFPPNVSSKNKRRKKKLRTEFSIRDKNIHVNIKWRKEQLKLKITNSKRKNKTVLKQCMLEYSRNNLILSRGDASPTKRKYIKREQTRDNLKQMSIESFFKVKTPEN